MAAYQIGVREFTRDFNKLQKFDIIEVIDKKTNSLKGIYLSAKEAQKFKELLKQEKKRRKKEKVAKIMRYAGTMRVDDTFKNIPKEEIKAKIAKLKAGMENV